jgi:hypothetical protein
MIVCHIRDLNLERAGRKMFRDTETPRSNGPGYNGQTLAVCNCVFLETLVSRKLFKIKNNRNIETFM